MIRRALAIIEPMKRVALSEIKDNLSRYLRMAEKEEVIITRLKRGVLGKTHSVPQEQRIESVQCAFVVYLHSVYQ